MEGFEGGVARPAPVPKMVQDFVVYFYRHIRERNIREIYTMYSHTFAALGDRFFKGGAWPRAEDVAHLVGGDHVFCLLYREMWYRAAHAAGRVTPAHRAEAWHNYRELFGVVLSSNLNMALPNGWLWDMVDEFCYQAQAHAQWAGRAGAAADDAAAAAAHAAAGVWAMPAAVAILGELAARSRVREDLAAPGGAAALYESEGYSATSSNVLRMLGYFSLVGLLRLHVVLGDPAGGLRALAPLHPLARRHLFATKIALAAVTMAYYSGVAYVQLGRWLDAARVLGWGAAYIARVKAHQPRGSPAHDQILKRNEQVHALLACCVALCPAAGAELEEATATSLREKYGEKVRAMEGGDAAAYEELWAYACPKFVWPGGGDPPGAGGANLAAYAAQLRAFLAPVHERRHLPALKAVLRLYSSVPVAKLAALAELDEPTARAQLELLRAAGTVLTWEAGDALSGVPRPAGELDFSVEPSPEGDMVVVREPRAAAARGDFLPRHVRKFEAIVADLAALPRAAPEAAAAAAAAPAAVAV